MDYVELTEEERASILADPEFLELMGEYHDGRFEGNGRMRVRS